MDYTQAAVYAKRLRLNFFSCVHAGDPDGHDHELWDECLDSIEQGPDALAVGLGDYLDFTRTTYRPLLKAAWGEDDNTHDEIDEMVMKQLVEPFVWKVRKRAPSMLPKHGRGGKLLGLIEGNHYWRFRNGTTSTQKICELLGVRYLGLAAWIRLTVYRSLGRGTKQRGTGHNLNILLNHSVSSSGNLPASLASATRKSQGFEGWDIFVSANDHQLGQTVEQKLSCTQRGTPREMMLQRVIGKAGSFQKGYKPGACATDYVEKKFLHPSRLGWLAFDTWSYHREYTKVEKQEFGVVSSPEVWRFGAFSA